MPILTQKSLLLGKVETTSGTDAAPVATTDAFLVTNPQFSVAATDLERTFARPDFSEYQSKIGRKLATISFAVPLAGSGTAGLDPTWATLFRGCSMAKATLVTPARVTYTPITTGQESLTLYLFYDGLLHVVTGAMGTFKLVATAGQFSQIDFTFTGNYNTPVSSTYPASVTLQNIMPPQVELAQFAFGGSTTLIANAVNYDMGNKVVARSDVNSANGYRGVRISGRVPSGGIDPEVEVTQAFWATMEASTTSAFTMTLGSVAGNQVNFAAPAAQIVNMAYTDMENLRHYNMSLKFRRNAGNDEFMITFF